MLFAAIANAIKEYPEDILIAGAAVTMPLWLQYCVFGSQLMLLFGGVLLMIFRVIKAARELTDDDDKIEHS